MHMPFSKTKPRIDKHHTHTHTHCVDLYYTRVTPSNQFDLLAEDFDYTLISAVVVGMFVATLVLSRLAANKTLNSFWK